MGSDAGRAPDPPVTEMSIEQIDQEQQRLHDEVGRLLDRISVLKDARASAEDEARSHMNGTALALEALTSGVAVERLRHLTRSMHPRLTDVQRYSADVSGLTPSWAPVVILHQSTHLSDALDLAAAVRDWFALFEPVDPVEKVGAVGRPRHGGHVLVDVRGTAAASRPRAQVWVRRDPDEAFALDGDTHLHRHLAEGTLAEVLVSVSTDYFGN